MSYNGSGVFNINTAGQPVVTGTVISSTAFNALTADLGTGLTTALTKDGQTTPTANIKLGGFKLTGIGVATTSGDALSYGQAATVSTLTNSALTSGRVTYAGTSGLLQDSANLTFNGTTLTANTLNLTNALGTTYGGTGLTSFTANGVVYASSSSALATGSAFTFDGTNLILGSANPLFQGSSSTGSAAISNNSAGAYIRVYGSSHATRPNYTDFINGTSTSTFDGSGNVGIGVTSPACILDISGSTGGQIKFPAAQNASSNANTLDDYERGTWTPTVAPQTGSLTAYTATAIYIKIGRQVFLQGKITITTAGTSAGVASIGAIPFQTGTTYIPTGTATETATTGANYAIYLNAANTTGVISSQNGLSGITWVNGYIYHFNITYST